MAAKHKPVDLFNLDTSDSAPPSFAARPSFDERPTALQAFEFNKEEKKEKKKKMKKHAAIAEDGDESGATEKGGRKKSVDDMDLPKPKKKGKKKAKIEEEKEEEVPQVRSRGITRALVDLTAKTTIVEDVHIADAWGTLTPTSRKISSAEVDSIRSSIVTGAVSPRLTTMAEDEDLAGNGVDASEKFKDGAAGWKGLLAGDDVEERVERIQGRRSSAPSAPKFLEKRAQKDEFEDVLESVEKTDKNGRPLPENIRRLLIEANMNWTESQFTLGYCYDTGSGGVEPNSQEAIHWYQEAAQAGHVTAQNNLGVLLATGHRNRIRPNHAEAFKWYEKAAKNGHPNAEFHLGLAFLKGDGVEKKNEAEAFIWFKNAAKQGHVLAQANVGAMYMSGQGIEQDFEKARKWCKKAASQGSAIAHHNLAVIYQRGYGSKPDEEMSRHHLREALNGPNAGIISKQLSEDTLKAGNTLMNM
jgi:TPR repeat protein